MVSFANQQQLKIVLELCDSFVLDNGAFTTWKSGKSFDKHAYYSWVENLSYHPNFQWALIPDVIDGTENENKENVDFVMKKKNFYSYVPVWHLHASWDLLNYYISNFPIIAIGSSGRYRTPNSKDWHIRMVDVFDKLVDTNNNLRTKVHGLRMMNPTLQNEYPFTSVDSCYVGLNVNIDKMWETFKFPNLSKRTRAIVLADHVDHCETKKDWKKQWI